jgi:hypothetical protein
VERGEEVALLAILDSSLEITGMEGDAGGEMEDDMDDVTLLMDIVAYVANLWHKEGLAVSREELERLGPEERLDHVLGLLRGADFLPPGAGTTQLRRALAPRLRNPGATSGGAGWPRGRSRSSPSPVTT